MCRATEAERAQAQGGHAPAQDALTRLPHRLEPDAEALWKEAAPPVERQGGVLVVDNSTLDKPYVEKIARVQWHGIVAPDSDREYWATNDLKMTSLTRIRFAGYAGTIETDHRGIKPYGGVERAQVRAALSATISNGPYAPSGDWNGIAIVRESVGLRQNSLSSDPPFETTCLINFTGCLPLCNP